MNELMTNRQSMSSLEIAERTGKRHDHVMRDIKKMLHELKIDAPHFWGTYKTEQGNTYHCYNLPKRESLILVSGYNVTMRAAIIDRWQELEQEAAQGTLQIQPNPTLESDKYIEASKVMKAAKVALGGFIKDKNQLAISCSQVAYKACGVDIVKAAGLQLIAQEQKQLLNVTEVGQQLKPKYTPREVNLLLAENGYQEKAQDDKGRNYWLITAKGEKYGLYQDTGKQHSSGAPVRQFKWYSSIIGELQNIIEELAA
jgi:phage regulator Rha-like protein